MSIILTHYHLTHVFLSIILMMVTTVIITIINIIIVDINFEVKLTLTRIFAFYRVCLVVFVVCAVVDGEAFTPCVLVCCCYCSFDCYYYTYYYYYYFVYYYHVDVYADVAVAVAVATLMKKSATSAMITTVSSAMRQHWSVR